MNPRLVYIIVLGSLAGLAIIGDVVLAVHGDDQSGLLKVAGTVIGALAVLGGAGKFFDGGQS